MVCLCALLRSAPLPRQTLNRAAPRIFTAIRVRLTGATPSIVTAVSAARADYSPYRSWKPVAGRGIRRDEHEIATFTVGPGHDHSHADPAVAEPRTTLLIGSAAPRRDELRVLFCGRLFEQPLRGYPGDLVPRVRFHLAATLGRQGPPERLKVHPIGPMSVHAGAGAARRACQQEPATMEQKTSGCSTHRPPLGIGPYLQAAALPPGPPRKNHGGKPGPLGTSAVRV